MRAKPILIAAAAIIVVGFGVWFLVPTDSLFSGDSDDGAATSSDTPTSTNASSTSSPTSSSTDMTTPAAAGAPSPALAFRQVYEAIEDRDCAAALSGSYFDPAKFGLNESDAYASCNVPDPNIPHVPLSELTVGDSDFQPSDADRAWARQKGFSDIATVEAVGSTSTGVDNYKIIAYAVEDGDRWLIVATNDSGYMLHSSS